MKDTFRLSRLSHPRASLWAMALLAIVFAAIGIWAEAAIPMVETARDHSMSADIMTLCARIFG